MFLCGNISADDCARELFKPLKDLATLCIYNKKIILVLGIFVSDIINGVVLARFWPTSSGPRPKPLDGSISLKFYWKLG